MAGMNSSNTIIKVSTDILSSRAGRASEKINAIDQRLKEINRVVKGTKCYWIGEAGESCRNSYEQQCNNINELMERLKKQPRTLLIIAGVYSQEEAKIVNIGSSLPDNVIG